MCILKHYCSKNKSYIHIDDVHANTLTTTEAVLQSHFSERLAKDKNQCRNRCKVIVERA